MTAGYGPGGEAPEHGVGEGWPNAAGTDRAGPLPPRIEPPRPPASAYPPPAGPGQPATPAQPTASVPPGGFPPPTVPAPRTTWPPPPNTGQWGGPAPTAPTSAPAFPSAPISAPAFPVAPAAGPAFPGAPPTGPVFPGAPAAGPVFPGAPGPVSGPAHPGALPPGASPPGRGRWLTVTALVLAAVLAGVVGVQAYQINRLSDRIADTDERLTAAQGGDGTRFDGLEKRAEALEKQAGATFNPEAIASAVLPSVFRVRAGEFTGTAFVVGEPAAGGGANLFTNFHVVESVWEGGGRQVFLERTDQRFPATIVKVDEENDIAHLRTTGRFTGLPAAPTPVKSGQQIVVVGAPLGLEDSVTTGVVSAFRKDEDGSGQVIQFDAPINPGNSGGPVINGAKQVVGIATAKARDAEGIGLAVPIRTACDGFRIC